MDTPNEVPPQHDPPNQDPAPYHSYPLLLSNPDVPLIERYGISPVLFAFLALITVFVLYQIIGGVLTLLLFGMEPSEENIMGYRVATGIGQVLFIFLPTLLLVRLATFGAGDYFRLRAPRVSHLFLSLIGVFSLTQMLQIYLVFQERIPFPESIQSDMEKFKELVDKAYSTLVASSSVPELLLVILIIAIIPAFAEEFLFRGLVQRSMEQRIGPVRAFVAAGVIFGAYHLNPFAIIPLMILGIYLGFLAYRADSLWVAVATHFYNNALACIAVYFEMENDAIVTGDPSTMSTGMLLATFWFFGIIFLVSTYYFIHITRRDEVATSPTDLWD